MRATSAVASTLALQAAGIRAGTSDPPGGRIGRGPGGELSGLLEGAAVYRVSGGGPEMSNDDVQALLRDLDSWHDIGDDWLRIWGVKLVMDGGVEGGALEQPYANDSSNCGHLNWEQPGGRY